MGVKRTIPMQAWAIMMPGGGLALTDYRLPLFWLRRVAQAYNETVLLGEGMVVRVTVQVGTR